MQALGSTNLLTTKNKMIPCDSLESIDLTSPTKRVSSPFFEKESEGTSTANITPNSQLDTNSNNTFTDRTIVAHYSYSEPDDLQAQLDMVRITDGEEEECFTDVSSFSRLDPNLVRVTDDSDDENDLTEEDCLVVETDPQISEYIDIINLAKREGSQKQWATSIEKIQTIASKFWQQVGWEILSKVAINEIISANNEDDGQTAEIQLDALINQMSDEKAQTNLYKEASKMINNRALYSDGAL